MMTCLLFLATPVVNAQAATEWNGTLENQPGQVIVPMWDYTNYTNTTLTISGSGTATATGVITGYQNITTSVSIYLYLQQYKNDAWTTIDSWYETFDSYKGTLEETTSVSPCYSYRVKASYYAYCGSDYENIINYSQTVSY